MEPDPMRHLLPTSFLATLLVLLPDVPVSAQQPDSVTLERGRQFATAFMEGRLDTVFGAFTVAMREAIGERELADFREQVIAQLGSETEVLDESVTQSGGMRVYQRIARFEKTEARISVTWAFDSDGRVAGFTIRPQQSNEPAASRHLDYDTKTPLRLPFDGEWTVFWGGRTLAQNYHAAHRDQRFAYDLVVTVDGSSHRGDGRTNDDYYCWNRPILAPGPGVVASVREGVPDNTPGEMNPSVPPGNHVVLDHGNGEYSLLAHFQRGTVRVEPGDTVAPGDALGLCGNSGNSSEPHLHYHLQNSPDFGAGEGLPAQFLDYEADGERVDRGEPTRGQHITQASGVHAGMQGRLDDSGTSPTPRP
jgi:hypothetical protein